MPAKLKHGVTGAAGGKREGSGRKPDWFREACQKALEDAKGLEFMRDVAAGKEFPQLATGEGEVLELPPPLKDRRAAVEWLADRGYGKAEQTVDMTVKDATQRPTKDDIESALASVRDALKRVGVVKAE
jgi:hypothetical protein